MKQHKHAKLIKAWADGAEIEQWSGGAWEEFDNLWTEADHWEFRVKPEAKPDVVRWCWASDRMGESKDHYGPNGSANLKVVFDGETGKLKSAQVIV